MTKALQLKNVERAFNPQSEYSHSTFSQATLIHNGSDDWEALINDYNYWGLEDYGSAFVYIHNGEHIAVYGCKGYVPCDGALVFRIRPSKRKEIK